MNPRLTRHPRRRRADKIGGLGRLPSTAGVKITLSPLAKALFSCLIAIGLPCPILAATVTIFAASSLSDSLQEIANGYGKQTGDQLVFNFAASGLLARQIEAGAAADLFISADESRMDGLQQQGLILVETRRSRLSNQLVIVTASDCKLSVTSPQVLAQAGLKRLALGDPASVPAGAYAKDYLARIGLWSQVEKKIVPCESVRSVLAAVESGNVDAGIVYQTDAKISAKVKLGFVVPLKDGPKISYPMAILKNAPQPNAARRYLDYLNSQKAEEVFARHGFILRDKEEVRQDSSR